MLLLVGRLTARKAVQREQIPHSGHNVFLPEQLQCLYKQNQTENLIHLHFYWIY